MSTNPVTRRVGMLSNQWLDVAADDRARVLCWKFAADEIRTLAGFLALELDERTAEHHDLFVELESEFVSAEAHGRHLGESCSHSTAASRRPACEEIARTSRVSRH